MASSIPRSRLVVDGKDTVVWLIGTDVAPEYLYDNAVADERTRT